MFYIYIITRGKKVMNLKGSNMRKETTCEELEGEKESGKRFNYILISKK